ncbi:hypothetical protein NUM3379_37550 [Kineococcus sp. NUM-3379]
MTDGTEQEAGAQPAPVLESAMATGSDAGEAGDRSPLPEPGGPAPDAAVEEAPEAVTAAADDTVLPPSVLPAARDTGVDPLTPRFLEPGAS